MPPQTGSHLPGQHPHSGLELLPGPSDSGQRCSLLPTDLAGYTPSPGPPGPGPGRWHSRGAVLRAYQQTEQALPVKAGQIPDGADAKFFMVSAAARPTYSRSPTGRGQTSCWKFSRVIQVVASGFYSRCPAWQTPY